MKKALLALTLIVSVTAFPQEEENALLKEIADNACQCIDSISLYNRAKKEVIDQIQGCIDTQAGAYQMGSKLANIDFDKDATEKDGEKQIDITVNMNKNSREYKEYYYEIERYLMNNCKSLEIAIKSNEKQSELSMSKDPEALRFYELGYTEAKEENCERAIEYYQEAVRIDPNFAFAWDNIGICYRRLGNYDKAIEAYENSLELDPYGIMPLQNIAIAYKYKKEYRKAIKAYEKLGKVHPGNAEVYYGIGHTYAFELNDYEEALENMCKAYKIYVEENSPFRSDAEQVIAHIYREMKKQGNEKRFNKILKRYNITTPD